MNLRIKKLRKSLDLTQQEFSSRIGTTANVLTNYETGRRNPSRSVINNICKTFNVNETWLRTGEGDMFEETPETSLDALTKEFNLTELEQRIISKYLHLSESDRMVIQKWVQSVFEETSTTNGKELQKPQTVEEVEAEYIKTMSALAQKQERTALSSTDADTTEKIS